MKSSSNKNRLRQFATLALAISERILPDHGSKFAPKTYTQPQLLACLLLKEYLRLDYRTTQEMLELSDGLRSALNLLSRVPDHSTLWWFARHKLEPKLLQEALEETVRRFKHGLRRPAEENDTGGPPRRHDDDAPKERLTRVVALGSIYPTARATSAGERSGTEDSEVGVNGHWRCGWNLRCSWRSAYGRVLVGILATWYR